MIIFKKPKKAKIAHDAYLTPEGLPDKVCEWLLSVFYEWADAHEEYAQPTVVIEPSVGEGSFAKAARAKWDPTIIGVDIRPQCGHICAGVLDYFYPGDWEDVAPKLNLPPGKKLILGNPPFTKAAQHIRQGMEILSPGDHLAFLLRVGFLGSMTRAKGFWKTLPGLKFFRTLAPRPSFAFDGNDNSEYAMYVWQKGWAGKVVMDQEPLIWRDEEDAA